VISGTELFSGLQAVYLVYFLGINVSYLMLNLIATIAIRRYLQVEDEFDSQEAYSHMHLPVSIVVPAFNESTSIIYSVKAMLQLEYPDYELIIVNDGSRDGTLEKLIDEFAMRPFPEAYRARLDSRPIRQIYRSSRAPNLRVIDKENGGKADSANAGINASRYPLVCVVDADSILQPDSLRRVTRPFLEDQYTVAVGGTVRVANGCVVRRGFIERIGLPQGFIARVQVVEYLRAFLFGRLGWSPLNALLIVSGAFGVFRKETLIEVGGFDADTVGEDMELIVRMHRILRQGRRKYRIVFVPDPVCWTDAPETLHGLRSQRIRWQRGLAEALMLNRSLICNPRGGTVSWLAVPFYLVFELFGPLLEIVGYLVIIFAGILGWLSIPASLLLLGLAISLGVLLSTSAIMLEELSFHLYPRARDVILLFLTAVFENFGYRQLTAIYRAQGLLQWLFGGGKKPAWEKIARSSSLSEKTRRVRKLYS